jgi:hypothetical protein
MKPVSVGIFLAAGYFVAALVAQDITLGGTVEGLVINSATGAGIAGASVVLFASQSARYQTTSDALGHFKITGMTPGSYRTNVDKDGFAPPRDFNFLSSPGLRVTSASDPVIVELKLTPLNAIHGRVLGPDGQPAAGIEVNLNPNLVGSEITDREGRFALEDIKPGPYILSARPPANATAVETKDGARTAMVTTYFPSVTDKALAQQIVFRGQGDFVGYEIRMQTAPVHHVRGMVLDDDGKPSPEAELTLLPSPEGSPAPMGLLGRAGGSSFFLLGGRRPPGGTPEATVIAGKDGRFEFSAVPPGDWRINATSDPPRDQQTSGGVSSRGSASAPVRRSDIDDLQIHVAAPFKFTGTIEWSREDPGNRRTFNPSILSATVILLNSDDNEFAAIGRTDSGTLSFENILPGRYKAILRPGVSGQVFLGESEVTGQTFPVAANGPRLRVALKAWSGTVRGTVEQGDGATVVLVPQRNDGVSVGQTIPCGRGGSFELSEVSPGDYYVGAFDQVDVLSPSEGMLSLMAARGTSVKVEEGTTPNVTLSVIATTAGSSGGR